MHKSLLLIALIATAASAAASDWARLDTDSRGVTAFIDRTSLRKNASLRYYAMKYVPPSPMNGASYTVMQEVVDCKLQTVTTLNLIAYRADDTVLGTYSGAEPARPIAPGSRAADIAQAVCSK